MPLFSQTDAAKVLAACPDNECGSSSRWPATAACGRPAKRWNCVVDWAQNRFTVHSPKTRHHTGKESRVVPLFPELRPYLDACYFEAADDGAGFVITRYRSKNANLRTQLERILKLAGVKPWPKLFQNLRMTRATELARTYPAHVTAEWLATGAIINRPVADDEIVSCIVRGGSLRDDTGDHNRDQDGDEQAHER